MASNNYKIAILNSHPIQYFGPLYKHINSHDKINLTVYYYSDFGLKAYFDKGFGREIQWDRDLTDGYEYKILPNVRKKNELKGFLKLINPALFRELKQGQFDAVIIHGTNYFTDVFAIFCCKLLGVQIFMRRSMHLQIKRSRSIFKEWIISFLTKMCDGCLSISERNTAYFRFLGVSEDKIHYIPHVVDNNHFVNSSKISKSQKEKLKSRYAIPKEAKVILYVAKLQKIKRPLDLLEAFRNLSSASNYLLIVGTGEEEENIKSFIRNHNIQNVILLGFINQQELPLIYGISDVFVLPSETETWGLVINEAMCAGLPVVTSSVIGAVPEIVKHGETAFTYETGDVNQLASYLDQLLEDNELRQRMSENALTFISGYNYELFSERLLNIMEHVTKER